MACSSLPPLLLVFFLGAASVVSNAGVAEAVSWPWRWHEWRHIFRGRYGHQAHHNHISSIVSGKVYADLFRHKDDAACPAKGFYNYSSFLLAAEQFPEFGSTGPNVTRRREVAAFLAQISHETTGGWPTAPDGPYAWGLCFKEELKPPSNYCDATNTQWPCVPGKSYHGRGPMQLSWNYNYGPAGKALCFDGLGDPDVVASDPVVAFKAALWFWMTPQDPKPSCHDVMVGRYKLTEADKAANRTAGFGLTTNIINGGLECNQTGNAQADDRVGYYTRYGKILDIENQLGPNLDCAHQLPYS